LSVRRLAIEKAPLAAMSLASAAVTLYAQTKAIIPTDVLTLPIRLENAVLSYGRYLYKMLWPSDLAVYYVISYESLLLRAAIVGAAIVGVTALVIFAGRNRRYLAAGWLWYLVTLIPVIGIVQVGSQSHADRYTYVPLIGIFVAIVWAMSDIASDKPLLKRAFLVAAAASLAACGIITHQALKHWKDEVSIFERAINVGQRNYVTLGNIGLALGNRGEFERGLKFLEEMRMSYPNDGRVLVAIGSLKENSGRPAEAIEYYEKALNLDPKTKDAQAGMASALVRSGRSQEALPYCRRAIELDASSAVIYNIMGRALSEVGKPDESLAAFRKALELRPDMISVYRNMIAVLKKKGDLQGAVDVYMKLIAVRPDYSTWLALGRAQFDIGRLEDAQRSCREAIRLDAKQAAAYVGLAFIFEKQGRKSEAVAELEKALAVEPSSAEAKETYERLKK
jgi:tetratricopeptide (TPR) repeat protein